MKSNTKVVLVVIGAVIGAAIGFFGVAKSGGSWLSVGWGALIGALVGSWVWDLAKGK